MIEKHIPINEEVKKFLKKIEQRIASNNENPLKPSNTNRDYKSLN